MNAPSDAATASPHRRECATEVAKRVDADDVWMIAHALVEQKGAAAPMIAASQARKLLDVGEIEKRLRWMRVMAASKALLDKEPA
ncbi:MAG: hypothetical protein L0210_04640 [Rhodospirillales bacterium]|nr:hypothetical protein [Rhodospirillales bacterium]